MLAALPCSALHELAFRCAIPLQGGEALSLLLLPACACPARLSPQLTAHHSAPHSPPAAQILHQHIKQMYRAGFPPSAPLKSLPRSLPCTHTCATAR
eukprot:365874-Chlamydomonas_euryale.AAC.7